MQWGRLQLACIAGGRNSAWKRGCQLPQNCHWQYPFACIVISVLSDSVTQVLRKCSTYPGKHKQIQTSVGRKSKRFSVTFFFFSATGCVKKTQCDLMNRRYIDYTAEIITLGPLLHKGFCPRNKITFLELPPSIVNRLKGPEASLFISYNISSHFIFPNFKEQSKIS